MKYAIGFLLGCIGTTAVGYAFLSLLPATRETQPRDPLPTRTIGSYTAYRGIGHDDTWTGPIT